MDWPLYLKNAKKSCMMDGKSKRVRYDFPDGKVMVEEYNTDTYVVVKRAWKSNLKIADEDQWDIELGEAMPQHNRTDLLIQEQQNQPFVTKRLTKINIEWRIRNLPYPLDTYQVTADDTDITVRTSNKKYYKKLAVIDLQRLNLKPEQNNISIAHKFNTLIITYKKPQKMLDFERGLLEEIKQMEPPNHGDNANCNPS